MQLERALAMGLIVVALSGCEPPDSTEPMPYWTCGDSHPESLIGEADCPCVFGRCHYLGACNTGGTADVCRAGEECIPVDGIGVSPFLVITPSFRCLESRR